jgi:PKD domain
MRETRRSLSSGFVRPLLIVMALAPAVSMPSAALACSLDGLASISVNGILAVRTTDTPTPRTLARWAPFAFGLAYAPGDVARFAEDLGKLRRSLPPAALAIPFRWDFGDGHSTRGLQTVHRYTRTGWYRVTVRSYWPSRRGWVLFDSAQLHIVPTAALWQANLGYRVLLGLETLTRVLAYGGWVVIIFVAIAWRVWHLRRRKSRRVRATYP